MIKKCDLWNKSTFFNIWKKRDTQLLVALLFFCGRNIAKLVLLCFSLIIEAHPEKNLYIDQFYQTRKGIVEWLVLLLDKTAYKVYNFAVACYWRDKDPGVVNY